LLFKYSATGLKQATYHPQLELHVDELSGKGEDQIDAPAIG